jgi:TonB family protein
MRTLVIASLLMWIANPSLPAQKDAPVYLGIDAKGVRHESKESAGTAPWMRDVAQMRAPTVSRYAGARWYQGVGIFRLRIDRTTGAIREVTIVRTTGHIAFDRTAFQTLKLWRWKPQTWTQVDLPIFFQRGGGALFFPRYTPLRVRG